MSAAAFLLFRKPLVKTGSRTWFSIGLYAVVGVGLTTFVFLGGIDGAASFSILTDTTFHLQCAQAMLQSGHYSVLSASVYPELIVRGEGGFYPAAWHILTAIAAGATAMPITVAHNAVNFVICAFVFPLSAWLLLAFLFRDKEETIIAGAFVCCSFASFPWNFLIAGQYDANLLAFSLMPPLSLFIGKHLCFWGEGIALCGLGDPARGLHVFPYGLPDECFVCRRRAIHSSDSFVFMENRARNFRLCAKGGNCLGYGHAGNRSYLVRRLLFAVYAGRCAGEARSFRRWSSRNGEYPDFVLRPYVRTAACSWVFGDRRSLANHT